MYVANSEPAIWCWGGGQAGVIRRDLISGEPNRHEAGRDTERWCVLPREGRPVLSLKLLAMTELRFDEETPKRDGDSGWQIHG